MSSSPERDLIAQLRAERMPVNVLVEEPIFTGHATTAELLREWEVMRWRKAEAEAEYGPGSMNATVVWHLVEREEKMIRAELHRRELAKDQPSAPKWPDAEPDQRAMWDGIKSRTDLVQLAERLLGEGIRRGPATWFRCYAHDDRTPSLAVYEDQHFHCYGCLSHGDCVDLVRGAMQLSSFQAAIAVLGAWSGVTTRAITIQRGDETIEVTE